MGHSHNHDHDHGSVGNIRVAFFINLAFTVIELAGGFFTNSIAILSDALHDLGDSLSLGLSWYFQHISGRARDKKYTYGYRRFSLLGAIVNGLVLVAGSVLILSEAIPRLWAPESPDAKGMFILAILGILFNGLAYLRLHSGHSHNERMLSLHLLEDVLGWAAVLLGSIVMYFFDVPIVDPLLSIGITLFILYQVIRNLRGNLKIILQASPEELDEADVEKCLLEMDEIMDVHDVHLWTLDGRYHILTAHLVLKNPATSLAEMACIKEKARHELHHAGIAHATLEFETADEKCSQYTHSHILYNK